jgi:hypothetical protein|tara:strand:- start:95 stop:259 length:165 start_codon:yes stop_codon:yes gene_type:complete
MDKETVRKKTKTKVLQIPLSDEDYDKIVKDAKKNGRTVPKQVYLECLDKYIKKI